MSGSRSTIGGGGWEVSDEEKKSWDLKMKKLDLEIEQVRADTGYTNTLNRMHPRTVMISGMTAGAALFAAGAAFLKLMENV